jgi:transposase-like protein
VYASARRDCEAACTFLQRARKATVVVPVEVITDRAPTYLRVLDQLWPAVSHRVERYANNRVEADHAQLKRRVRAMRGIKTMTGLGILAAGHAFVQNPAPRPLRNRHRPDSPAPTRHRVHRTGRCHLRPSARMTNMLGTLRYRLMQ